MQGEKLTENEWATLREMAGYRSGYIFRQASCRKLHERGLCAPLDERKRPYWRVTDAGRAALESRDER